MTATRRSAKNPSERQLPDPASRGLTLAVVLLVLGVLAAYANIFSAPFVYDDQTSILDNPSIRHLWSALFPPVGGLTVAGRPALNFSLALNYAAGGFNPAGYHAFNVFIHACAGLVLFGLVRRTLLQPGLRAGFADAALPIAFIVAALWLLHPLQTEAVSYMIQRAESLMGLFYLLTLYAFVRGTPSMARESADASSGPARSFPGNAGHLGHGAKTGIAWYALSVAACVLGMATKEVMVSAPLMVLLYDRTFVAGTFQEAWRTRRGFYLTLAATWIPLALLVASTGGNRGGSIGFGIGVSWWAHALTQYQAITRYLLLSVWPHPLVFDYGPFWVRRPLDILPQAALVSMLVAGTGYALWRNPVLGFLGAWFLLILAPTSVMPGPTQMIVEHRMYLSLAAVLALIVPGIYRFAGRRGLATLLAAAIVLGAVTFQRNRAYRSGLALWQDTAAKRPANPTAHGNLGAALAANDRKAEAIAEYQTAIQLMPDYAEAHTNLGDLLSQAGQSEEALQHLQTALQLRPGNAEVQLNLGTALDRLGRTAEAIPYYERALQIKPELAEAHYNYASALAQSGRMAEATVQFEAGLRLKPGDAVARQGWANALARVGRGPEAIVEYEAALRLKPDYPEARYNYGTALAMAGRFEDAVQQYTEAVRLQPDNAEAHNNLGNALIMLHREPEAIAHYQESLRLKPNNASACNNLGLALARLGRIDEAAVQFAAAVRLAPDNQEMRENLMQAQAQLRSASR